MTNNFCKACAQVIHPTDITCLRCNTAQGGDVSTPLITAQSQPEPEAKTEKTKLAAALLALAEAIRYLTLSEEDFQAKAAQLNGPFSFLW